MPGKKPKERQRYMLRVNDTLVEVTRQKRRDFQWLCLWKRCGKRASYVRQIYSGFGALLGKGISY